MKYFSHLTIALFVILAPNQLGAGGGTAISLQTSLSHALQKSPAVALGDVDILALSGESDHAP